MKHNWTYKKLGEVVTIGRGGSPRPIQDYITTAENGLNWIKIGDAVDGSKYITSTKEKIRPEGLKKTRFVHKGDFILSNSMSFGRPYILGIDGCIHDGWLVLHDDNETFDKSYLYYYLSSSAIYAEFKRLAVGGVVNNLNSNIVRNVKVAIPSLDEQQAIVRELDGINRLIDLQEEQLREYDRLAQSLFYTTFGDPFSNPKGWEVKKLGEVAPCVKYNGDIQERKGKYWLLNLDMVESQTGNVIDYLWVDKSEVGGSTTTFNEDYVLYSKLRPYLNKVVLPSHSGYCTTELLPLLPCKDLHKIYLALVLRSKAFVDYIQAKVAGAKMPRVTMNDFKGFNIPLPPLALQQTFAAQIEAIEQQKALIRRSLDETRTLLAARMQYYFE